MKRLSICLACLILLAGCGLAQTKQTAVTVTTGQHSVTIPVSDTTPGLTSYIFVRSATQGVYDWTNLLQTIPGTASSMTDSTVTAGTWYYEAKAVIGTDQSPASNEVSALVPQPPNAPSLGTPVVN